MCVCAYLNACNWVFVYVYVCLDTTCAILNGVAVMPISVTFKVANETCLERGMRLPDRLATAQVTCLGEVMEHIPTGTAFFTFENQGYIYSGGNFSPNKQDWVPAGDHVVKVVVCVR